MGDVSNHGALFAYFLVKLAKLFTIELLPCYGEPREHKYVVSFDLVEELLFLLIYLLASFDVFSLFPKEEMYSFKFLGLLFMLYILP